MFGIGKSEEERRREKERKKRGMRKYGQSYLSHRGEEVFPAGVPEVHW